MLIRLAFLCPYNNQGIGGGDRKFGIYYKNLDKNLFDGYMIFVTKDPNTVQTGGCEVILTEDMIEAFCQEKGIEYIYFGGGKITPETEDILLKNRTGLVNVNFTPLYTTDPRKLNLIISMTDYWKLVWMHGTLSNSYAVYNPIDVENWENWKKKAQGIYREKLSGKKYIIGRMARAEPSKWHWLILATLKRLDKEKNYDFGFLFAGMPWLYRKWIQIFLSKKMQSCILNISEQREHKDIAEFYASIDMFWQTSWIGESFGNVIAEAACFNVPTITDYKAFYKNGHVNPLLYDAQIELVDAGKTGTYTSRPEGVLQFLKTTTEATQKTLGENAYKKVCEVYAIEHTIRTLAKVLYIEGKKRGYYKMDDAFENLQENPDKATLESYGEEYGKRVAIGEQFDTIGAFSDFCYGLSERLWRGLEYVYLVIRRLLKKYISFDIEKL